MCRFTPSLDPGEASAALHRLLVPHIDPLPFRSRLGRLDSLFNAYRAGCPPPWPAPGLVLSPEDRYRSELWLPLAEIRPAFEALYRAALRYAPIYSSSPLHSAASWFDIVADLSWNSADPASVLRDLLADEDRRRRFLFQSFMPGRFYGASIGRYQGQTAFIRDRLSALRPRTWRPFRCCDAACGDGGDAYLLGRMLLEQGRQPDEFRIEGWSIEPLEVWSAAFLTMPHDLSRERTLRGLGEPVVAAAAQSFLFRQADLLDVAPREPFDLILCNGLLGGPIIDNVQGVRRVVANLAGLLAPGGMLLAADRFHGGWKKKIPGELLGDLFRQSGLRVCEAGEGLCGIRT